MNKPIFSSALIFCSFGIFLAAGAAWAEPADTVTEVGKKHFNTYCSSCHGLDARGSGPAASALTVAPPNLRKIAERRNGSFPVDEITAKIDGRDVPAVHGTSAMPVWGRQFSEKLGGGTLGEEAVRGELYVLIKYLQSIQE